MIALKRSKKPTGTRRASPKKRTEKSVPQPQAMPATERIYLYDSATMLALSHVIEDLAAETGSGHLVSTFQLFSNFEPQRPRYTVLGQRLQSVRVWGRGKPPKAIEGVDFVPIEPETLMQYWVVLFESEHIHALLLCRQKNSTGEFPKKKFIGYYTFNRFLVESVRRHLNLLTSGLPGLMQKWEALIDLPR
jgi:DICT domain-containing protein